jgi:S1-C subfamily serine protease
VLTASHLVGQARTVTLQTFTADSYPESASINESAAVIARSEDADLAIIRFLADQNVPASLQICPPQRIPETVNFAAVTLGCGLNAPTPEVLQVLGKKRVSKGPDMDPTLVWELSVEQESGRSGGPLVDQHGFVLGILSGTSEGRGFASHTEELHRFLAQNGLQWLWAAKH